MKAETLVEEIKATEQAAPIEAVKKPALDKNGNELRAGMMVTPCATMNDYTKPKAFILTERQGALYAGGVPLAMYATGSDLNHHCVELTSMGYADSLAWNNADLIALYSACTKALRAGAKEVAYEHGSKDIKMPTEVAEQLIHEVGKKLGYACRKDSNHSFHFTNI